MPVRHTAILMSQIDIRSIFLRAAAARAEMEEDDMEVVEEGSIVPVALGPTLVETGLAPTNPATQTMPTSIEARRAQMDELLKSGDKSDINLSKLDRPRASSASKKKRKSDEAGNPPKKPRMDAQTTEPKTVTAQERAADYAHEGFVVSNGTDSDRPRELLSVNCSQNGPRRSPLLFILPKGDFFEAIDNQKSSWRRNGQSCKASATEIRGH